MSQAKNTISKILNFNPKNESWSLIAIDSRMVYRGHIVLMPQKTCDDGWAESECFPLASFDGTYGTHLLSGITKTKMINFGSANMVILDLGINRTTAESMTWLHASFQVMNLLGLKLMYQARAP